MEKNDRPWRKWYQWKIWQDLREQQLLKQPLCQYCLRRGDYITATVVNHIKPHKGDWDLFVDVDNHESLCKSCHDSEAQTKEIHGYEKRVGLDGWPVDDDHPINKGR